MIRVDSNYQYCGEILPPNEVVLVLDHHYDENSKSYPLLSLLQNSKDPSSLTVVFYTVVQHEDKIDKQFRCIFAPYFTALWEQQFNQEQIIPGWNRRLHTFNFMINKPRRHREFLLYLIDYFGLNNYTYTLCWKMVNDQMFKVENPQYQHLQKYVTIPPKQFLLGSEQLLDRGLKYGHITNAQNYKAFLKDHVFEPSCVSLITEPAFFEKEIMPTEKTLMAIWGGTIPIWVGGWRLPDYMRSLGFDVFDDLVDHSYQCLDDPYDRCYYAIERNLKLLQNFNLVQSFIADNQDRFEHNLKLLSSGVFSRNYQRNINQCSMSVQQSLRMTL